MGPFIRVCAIAGLFSRVPLARRFGPEAAAWHDPSPHCITFVTVDNGVKLEILDWGGSGRAIVLLAGYQTAHEYHDIAPKLAAFGHVYGITRRGLALPVDQTQATRHSGRQKTFCRFSMP